MHLIPAAQVRDQIGTKKKMKPKDGSLGSFELQICRPSGSMDDYRDDRPHQVTSSLGIGH
jgi:hypothetical protein